MSSLPPDIRAQLERQFPGESDRTIAMQRLASLWHTELNVGPGQLARGILILAGSDRQVLEDLFDSNFWGDPRDVLVAANERNPDCYYGNTPFKG